MVVRRHKKGLVLTLDYACRSSTEKPMICHAGLSFKQHVWVATVIMYQILSIWALLADSLDWCHRDAANICLLVIGVTNIALATVGVVYVTDILAQGPAGFDIVQILGPYMTQANAISGQFLGNILPSCSCFYCVTAPNVNYCVQTCRKLLLHKTVAASLSAISFSKLVELRICQ